MLATATTLASGLMRICGQVAWEVDAGLRPEGKAGPLVRTPASHAAYYQRWAAHLGVPGHAQGPAGGR